MKLDIDLSLAQQLPLAHLHMEKPTGNKSCTGGTATANVFIAICAHVV